MGVRGSAWAVALGVLAFLARVEGHGRMNFPAGRSTAWRHGFGTPVNYNDDELNCGGLGVRTRSNTACFMMFRLFYLSVVFVPVCFCIQRFFYFYSFIIFLNFFSSLCNVSLVLSYYDDFIRYIAITNWNKCTYIVSRKNTLFLFNF